MFTGFYSIYTRFTPINGKKKNTQIVPNILSFSKFRLC